MLVFSSSSTITDTEETYLRALALIPALWSFQALRGTAGHLGGQLGESLETCLTTRYIPRIRPRERAPSYLTTGTKMMCGKDNGNQDLLWLISHHGSSAYSENVP